MEARKYEGFTYVASVDEEDLAARQQEQIWYEQQQQTTAASQIKPLSQEYVDIRPQQIDSKWQRRQISFFTHLAVYAVLFSFSVSLAMAVMPTILALPLGAALPVGLIFSCKWLWKRYIQKQK